VNPSSKHQSNPSKVFLKSNVKKRPWPLPDGFRYVQPKGGTLMLKINKNGLLVPLALGKANWTNLLVRNVNFHYFYITKDQLVPINFKYNTGQATPDWSTAINLHKPI